MADGQGVMQARPVSLHGAVRIAHQEEDMAALGQATLACVMAAKDHRIRAVLGEIIERDSTLHVGTHLRQFALEETGRPHGMVRLHS
jgi:hypothetical protein